MAQLALQRRLDKGEGPLTPEMIASQVRDVIGMFGTAEVDPERIVAELEASFQTFIGRERTLEDQGHEPWLPSRRGNIDWRFWTRYRQHLAQRGFPEPTLNRLDESTDRVVGLLTDPTKQGTWDRRGMVVGHVQSGKTAHYTGVISKAADAGYKLVIVLAGLHKSLRSQTQIRLEEGFLGYDAAAAMATARGAVQPIGVGLIDSRPRADSITTRADNGDFKRTVARHFAINPGGNPLLFVVKKNASVLRNLLNWIAWAARSRDDEGREYVREVPLLVIDDEADHGSIDTRAHVLDEDGNPDPEHDPTTLNALIREILNSFEQSAYIAYTATPFANIFIHEGARTDECGEDLFPRSFIVSLPSASTYVGPVRVFGLDSDAGDPAPGLPIMRPLDDYLDPATDDEDGGTGWMPPGHRPPHVPLFRGEDHVPPSLRQAILSFVLVCAARKARGQDTSHNSMLVHVTRFTAVQKRVTEQVRDQILRTRERLRLGEGEASGRVIDELERLWRSDFMPTTEAIAEPGCDVLRWSQVAPHVQWSASSIEVREINGTAGDVLDYVAHEGTGLNVIAIGGDKLSRGLTLEGLTISYFLRASRMYDTLMQMGRWFGYRPGYLDLCRLYTTTDLIDWFTHITAANEELRDDFNRMAASGGTPRDYGLRVLSHPGLLVTSQVKMRHGTTLDISFEGDISETINFHRKEDALDRNWNAARTLIEAVEADGSSAQPHPGTKDASTWEGSWKWSGVDAQHVVDFLTEYTEHPASRKVKTRLLADYVRQELEQGRLDSWTILVAAGGQVRTERLGSSTFRLVKRSWHLSAGKGRGGDAERERFKRQGHFRIRRLINPPDEAADLSRSEWDAAMTRTLAEWEASGDERRRRPDKPGGPQIREVRDPGKGLLLLYPLDPEGDSDITEVGPGGTPVLGIGISFPCVDVAEASRVQYQVNNVYYEQEFGDPA